MIGFKNLVKMDLHPRWNTYCTETRIKDKKKETKLLQKRNSSFEIGYIFSYVKLTVDVLK